MSKSFFRAIQKGSASEVRRLLREHSSHVVSKDDDGKTALHIAAESGNLAIVKTLIGKRADVNAVDSNGWTPLHCAANKAHFETCEELLKARNIDVSISNNDDTTALMYLVRLRNTVIQPKLKLYKRVLKLMVQKDADVNAINMFGEAPLHAACLRGTLVSVSFLLNNQADVNVLNSKQETALHWAVRMNKPDIVTVLMKYGADPFLACANGTTPMELAIETKSESIIKLMTTKALVCEEAKKECAKTGYLSRYIRKGYWESVFCVLKETSLFVYRTDSNKEKPLSSYDIMEVSFSEVSEREKREKAFAFSLAEADRTTIFASDDEMNGKDWEKLIMQGQRIYKHINSMPDSKDEAVASASKSNRVEPEEINNHLMSVLDDPGNLVCADCNAGGAFWMLVTYGALLCFDCAEIHSRLNTSAVKSIHFDSWLLDDALKLKCNGNIKHNMKMETNLPLNAKKPTILSPTSAKEEYIKLKYQSAPTGEIKSSPRTMELKRVLASRISKYDLVYNPSQLIQALSIPQMIWDHLNKTSALLKQLRRAVENDKTEKNDKKLIQSLTEKQGIVLGPCAELIPSFLAFVRAISQAYSTKQSTRTPKTILKALLVKYEEIQLLMNDKHVEIMMKWWLPQVVEVVAIMQAGHDRYDLSTLIEVFVQHSVIVVFLMTGEYLLCQSNLQNDATLSDPELKQLSVLIKDHCKAHTENIRNLLHYSYKYQHTNTEESSNQDSYSQPNSGSGKGGGGGGGGSGSVRSVMRTNSDSPFLRFTRRNSSQTWSQSSAENHSPRGSNDTFQDDDDHPLVNLYNQSPNSLSSMLCSVVSELAPKIQSSLLGVVFSGHNFVSSPNCSWETIFASSNLSLTLYLSQIQAQLESLRTKWPTTTASSQHPSVNRPIYLIKNQLEAIYSLPVQWTLPEVWDCWTSLHTICKESIQFLYSSAKSGKNHTFVMEIFCMLIVQLRWTYEKLREVQANDSCNS